MLSRKRQQGRGVFCKRRCTTAGRQQSSVFDGPRPPSPPRPKPSLLASPDRRILVKTGWTGCGNVGPEHKQRPQSGKKKEISLKEKEKHGQVSSAPACPSKGMSSSPPLPPSPSFLPVTTTMTVTNRSPKWDLEYQCWARMNGSLQQILFPLNVMKFTRSFIGAAWQSLLLLIKATTPASMCGERHNNVCMTGGMLLRRRGLCAHADNNPLQTRLFRGFLTGAPVRGSQCHRVRAAELLAQQTFHHAGGEK